MLGEVAPNGPIQIEIASKSNVRQTVARLLVMVGEPSWNVARTVRSPGRGAALYPPDRGWRVAGPVGPMIDERTSERYCSVMIPPFAPGGNLPPGIHWATWEEVVERFGWTERQQLLLAGLRRALNELKAAGCRSAYVDGSFVTIEPEPGDFDVCWETEGIDWDRIDPTLLTFDDLRREQKAKFGGECFPADAAADLYGTTYLDFFQVDEETEQPKGIVGISLGDEP
jgi:hypothetical protein